MVEKKIVLIFYMGRFSMCIFIVTYDKSDWVERIIYIFSLPFFVLILKTTHSFKVFHDLRWTLTYFMLYQLITMTKNSVLNMFDWVQTNLIRWSFINETSQK